MNWTITLGALATLTACGSMSTLGEVTPGPESNTAIGNGYIELHARNAALNAAYDYCRGYNVLNIETNYYGTEPESERDPADAKKLLSTQKEDYEVTIIFTCDESPVEN
jgi:hypothetical protein